MEGLMHKLAVGTNVTVFLLFFGVALLDAARSHDWLQTMLWLALGFVFLRADALKHRIVDRSKAE